MEALEAGRCEALEGGLETRFRCERLDEGLERLEVGLECEGVDIKCGCPKSRTN